MATRRSKRSRKKKKDRVGPVAPVSSLPDEMIMEILLRSSVKSLIRFKCVCKLWNSLISDPEFVKKHLCLAWDNGLENQRMLLRYPYHSLKSCPLQSVYCEPFGYSVELDFPTRDDRSEVNIIGSCNGLVCFRSKKTFMADNLFLWNPTTGEYKLLPSSDSGYAFRSTYQFGYSCAADDYKVVKLSLFDFERPSVEVYSLRNDSWKKIEDFPFMIRSINRGLFVNGTLNWGVNRDSDQFWVIVSFDLTHETFREIPQPDYRSRKHNPLLRVLSGCLCVLCYKTYVSIDIWLMKEYGVEDSWRRLLTMPYLTELKSFQFPKSLCFCKSGGILMYYGRTLIIYDMRGKTLKYPIIYGVQDCHEAVVYIESLVSPNAYARTGCNNNN